MKVIIHCANLIQSKNDPFLGIKSLYYLGYRNFEIDLWVQHQHLYKFCHPSKNKKELKFYKYNDPLIEKLLEIFDDCIWFIDIKFKELQDIPVDLIQYISSIPKSSNVVVTSTSFKLLNFACELKLKTGLIINDDNISETYFKPDFYITTYENLKDTDLLSKKVIPFFRDKKQYDKITMNNIKNSYLMLENPLKIGKMNANVINLELEKITDVFEEFKNERLYEQITNLVKSLFRINKEQWDFEDLMRNPAENLNGYNTKQNIDTHNQKRIAIIDEIDDLIIKTYNPYLFDINDNIFCNSESIGRLLDKILILIIRKIYSIREFSKGHENYEEKIFTIEKHLKYNISILDKFVKNVVMGTASYAPEGNMKDYKPREFKIDFE